MTPDPDFVPGRAGGLATAAKRPPELVRAIGRKGGQATTAAKAAAARANARKPCRPGRKRGWPLGVPRKPLPCGPDSATGGIS